MSTADKYNGRLELSSLTHTGQTHAGRHSSARPVYQNLIPPHTHTHPHHHHHHHCKTSTEGQRRWQEIPPRRQRARCAAQSRCSCPLSVHLAVSGPRPCWSTGDGSKALESCEHSDTAEDLSFCREKTTSRLQKLKKKKNPAR